MTMNSTARQSPVTARQSHQNTGVETIACASAIVEVRRTIAAKVRMFPTRRMLRVPIRHPASKPRK